jgi:hypothetical protein
MMRRGHRGESRDEFDQNPLFAIMIVFMIFLGASSPGCNRPVSSDRSPTRYESDACPIGRFPTTGEHAGCRCPDEQDKRIAGPFEMFAKCIPRPRPALEEPMVEIECNDPPDECTYEGRILEGSIHEVSCGTLVCPEPVCTIHCAEPPANCRYAGQVAAGACGKVTCGKLVCEEGARCPDGERRLETCWSEGLRGQARYVCQNGRWHAGACELGEARVPIELQ